MCYLLEAEGFQVLHASSGETALSRIREQPLSLITLERGVSSRLCSYLKPGEPVVTVWPLERSNWGTSSL